MRIVTVRGVILYHPGGYMLIHGREWVQSQ